MNDLIIDTVAAAALIGVDKTTVAKWRKQGRGPRFHVIGKAKHLYLREEVMEWIAARDTKLALTNPATA